MVSRPRPPHRLPRRLRHRLPSRQPRRQWYLHRQPRPHLHQRLHQLRDRRPSLPARIRLQRTENA